jgi:hypothetical protein
MLEQANNRSSIKYLSKSTFVRRPHFLALTIITTIKSRVATIVIAKLSIRKQLVITAPTISTAAYLENCQSQPLSWVMGISLIESFSPKTLLWILRTPGADLRLSRLLQE